MKWYRALNPFQSLFGRILLWFWATLLIIMLVTSVAMEFLLSQGHTRKLTDEEHQLLFNSARQILIDAYENQLSVAQSLLLFNSRSPNKLLLIDENYRLVGGQRPPDPGAYWLSTLIGQENPLAMEWDKLLWLGPFKLSIDGRPFTMVLQLQGNEPPAWLTWANSSSAQALVSVLISGALSLFLAWSLVRPIRSLRKTSAAIASGDLEARVSDQTVRRGDELGDLAREFNRMAAKVEQLLQAHQNLLANVSHELRSPLTRMQLAMGILRNTVDEHAGTKIDRLELEAQRLETLIAQLLKWSRLNNNLAHIEKYSLNLVPLVEEVVDDASIEAEDKSLKLLLSCDLPSAWIDGDKELLFSAFNNLLRNAIRYSPPGGEIQIRCYKLAHAMQIDIIDQGPGIDDSELELIFEPFQRAVNSQPGGAGLGLSIAREAINYHQGQIFACNQKAGGLKVSVSLPCSTQASNHD